MRSSKTLMIPFEDGLRRLDGRQDDEVVAAHVPQEIVSRAVLLESLRQHTPGHPDYVASRGEAVVVVEGLEVVEVDVEEGELPSRLDALDQRALDSLVPGQLGDGTHIAVAEVAPEVHLDARLELHGVERFCDVAVSYTHLR